MGEIAVLNQRGDTPIQWDPESPTQVASAKQEFARLKKEGYEFFEVVPESKGKRVTRFDKKLGKVIASPGVQSKADKATGDRPRAMAGGPRAARVA